MKWFTAKAKAGNPRVAHITIDGEIGRSWWADDGVASNTFMREVKSLGELDEIIIDANSPGGSVTDGITIANYLRDHPAKVTVNVLGQASSIMSVITAAADVVNMGLGSWMFVHKPWTVALGNADQLRALAGDLDTIGDGIMAHYIARVGEERRDEMWSLMTGDDGDGTILSAERAVELGLADNMMVETKAAASMASLARAMAHGAEQARAKLQQQSQPPKAMTAADALALALAFDITPEEAEAQAADLGDQIIALRQQVPVVAKLDDIPADLLEQIKAMGPGRIEVAPHPDPEEVVAAERTRITAIIKACQTTGQPQLMEKLVDNGMAAEQAQEYIYDVAAAHGNRHTIHNSHSPEGGHRVGIDYQKIYDRQNRKATA
ncbi:head maturation protease, ClpP-related [Billgrantia bachuensis]|uniref:Clp protease ClpP n=1 Tax=Billgrantia bachuensis TaxID=2717286 RepID=A0ABX0PT25_9GAMM|nr:head maturation protease, ClpP-related [Halomonas bachuensis]NIC05258.1 Clp protease ClpP [Halomonas bachuensis]